MEIAPTDTPKEFAALVSELQERQGVEVSENREAYSAWKEDLKRSGKTPSDAVAWCRAQGFTEYANLLEKAILQMEESSREPLL